MTGLIPAFQSTNSLPELNLSVMDAFLKRYDAAKEKFNTLKSFLSNMDSSIIRERVVSEVVVDGAELKLRAELWQELFALSGVGAFMHKNALDEWNKSIEAMEVPEFTRDNVVNTFSGMMANRQKFFAEMIDDVFTQLSGEHVTNRPEGFYTRLIFDLNGGGEVKLALHKLRYIVSILLNRPGLNANIILGIQHITDGRWRDLDGGSLRIRSYKKGTAHLEVHPDIAWRMNEILATLHPMALPEKSRKPKRNIKPFDMGTEFVDASIIHSLNKESGVRVYKPGTRLVGFSYDEDGEFEQDRMPSAIPCHILKMSISTVSENKALEELLIYLGGRDSKRYLGWEFDYDPTAILRELMNSGVLPSKKDHQAYFTPDKLGDEALELLCVSESDRVLEPSAGTGAMAKKLPKDQTLCVEVSNFHAGILSAQGFNVVEADFLAFARSCSERFDRILMNPPYSKGRAVAHCEAALNLLDAGGRAVMIVPKTTVNELNRRGFNVRVHKAYDNAFSDASVNVVMAYLDK